MASRPISVKLKAEDADSIVAALRKTGDAGQAMADQLEKSFTPTARAVENLRRNLDPLYETQQRIASSTALLDRAFKAGTVSAQQHSEMITLLNARYAPAVAGTRNLGTAVQQAGFQIGDFAVQVASGQSAIRAFVQQGTQLLGVFGPVGAAAGALLAVVGAVAASFIDLGKNTDEASKAQDLFREAVEKTNAVLDTSAEATKRAAAEKKELAIATNTAAAAAATEQAILLQRQLAQAQQDAATLQAGGPGLTPELTPILARSAQQVAQLTVQLDSAQAAADAALEAVDKLLNNPSGADRDEAAKTDKAIAKKQAETKAVEEYIQKLRDQLQAQQQEESQRAEITAVIQGQAKAQEDYNKGLRDTPLLRQEEVDAIKQVVTETERLKDSEKERHDAAKDAAREAEQHAKDEKRSFDRFIDQSAHDAADILYDGFSGRIKDIGDLLSQTLKRAAANIVAEDVFKPLFTQALSFLGVGPSAGGGSPVSGIGSSLSAGSGILDQIGSYLGFASVAPRPSPDFVGPMPLNPGILGGTSLSGFLGGAGLGFGAGSFLNSALGRTGARATNGTIGAGVGALGGALIGSLIPGVGTILGGLLGGAAGGGLGGLIGPKPSVGPGQGATLAFTDFARVYGAAADNGGDASAAAAWAGAIGQAVAQAIQASGGTGLAGGGRSVSIFNNKQGFRLKLGGDNTGTLYGSQDEANAAALSYLLGGGITGASGSVSTAIRNSLAGGNANNLLSDIQFARSIDRLGLSQVEQQVAALNDQYGQQIDRAQKLGLATDELIKKRDEDIAATRNAAQVAAQQSALTASGGAASTIYSFLNAQSLSADSSLSPTARLTEAQRQFGDLLSAVRGGDLSQTGALTQAAGNLLTIGRQNYASSVDFTNIESFVRSSLKGVASTVTSDQYIADQITKAIAAADQSQADRDAQLVSTLKSEMALLRQKIEALAA